MCIMLLFRYVQDEDSNWMRYFNAPVLCLYVFWAYSALQLGFELVCHMNNICSNDLMIVN